MCKLRVPGSCDGQGLQRLRGQDQHQVEHDVLCGGKHVQRRKPFLSSNVFFALQSGSDPCTYICIMLVYFQE